MLKVTKFGGSSLCDSAGFARVREIVLADPARRVVVVSAAGKRHAADHKITDLLYLCHAHLQYEVSCWDLWRRVADRYREIRDGCALTLPIEAELEAIYAAMDRRTPRDWIVSRGEYLSARLMADLLGFDFVDAKDWLLFDAAGRVRPAASYAALGSLADGRKIVTPGFYGALPDGQIHTLPRGGSDVTGALAAAALHADLYENWTDVPGVLAADPALVQRPAQVEQLRYEELQTLSRVGMQVLHEDAVAPVQRAQIPLRICSTLEPETPGTLVRTQLEPGARQICFAGRRQLALLRLYGRRGGAGGALPPGGDRAVFPAERLRRDGGHFADGTRLRGAAPPAGAGAADAAAEALHAAGESERARRAVPQHGVGPRTCAGGRVRRRAGAPAAQVRRMRPPARQRQPV